jgi:catalase
MAKMKTGWKKQHTRHSRARKYGRAGGTYKHLTKEQKKRIMTKIKKTTGSQTHAKKMKPYEGLYYLKAGKVHRQDLQKDRHIKAIHKRNKQDDTWRGDYKPSLI